MALREERFTLGGGGAVAVPTPTTGTWRRDRIKYAFLLPGVVWILAFTIFPLLYAVRLSFFNYKLGSTERFIGLANYTRAFTDDRLWQALFITLRFVVLTVGAT